MTNSLSRDLADKVMSGYYNDHPQGVSLFNLDLDEVKTTVVGSIVDELVVKNKRIEYLEFREQELMKELNNIREKTDKTHVTKN